MYGSSLFVFPEMSSRVVLVSVGPGSPCASEVFMSVIVRLTNTDVHKWNFQVRRLHKEIKIIISHLLSYYLVSGSAGNIRKDRVY